VADSCHGVETDKREATSPIWLISKLSPTTFGVRRFTSEEDRQAHLDGKHWPSLMSRVDEMRAKPPSVGRRPSGMKIQWPEWSGARWAGAREFSLLNPGYHTPVIARHRDGHAKRRVS